jgi:hypothetical protein
MRTAKITLTAALLAGAFAAGCEPSREVIILRQPEVYYDGPYHRGAPYPASHTYVSAPFVRVSDSPIHTQVSAPFVEVSTSPHHTHVSAPFVDIWQGP